MKPKRKTTKASRTKATRRSVRSQTEPAKVKVTTKPKASAGSLARTKATLISELRDLVTTPERQQAIRDELATEPLASTPILSPAELRRLGD